LGFVTRWYLTNDCAPTDCLWNTMYQRFKLLKLQILDVGDADITKSTGRVR